jgi:hypothetical protein
MFERSKIRRSDPFRLSAFGRCRATMSWLHAPARVSRVTVGVAAMQAAAICMGVVFLVMHAASPSALPAASVPPPATSGGQAAQQVSPHLPDLSVGVHPSVPVGPGNARLAGLAGYDCGPLPAREFPPRWDLFGEPLIVVVSEGSDGLPVLWGPSCVISGGMASR